MDSMERHKRASLIKCIQLSGAGARGILLGDDVASWQDVIATASVQNVLPLVSCALLHNPNLSCPARLKEQLLNSLRMSSAKNIIRRQRVLNLLQEIERFGIPVQVLKGYSVSQLYAHPESRESVDNDILIDIADEAKLYSFLSNKGFSIKGRQLTANDGVCEHREYGKLEVHVGLYPEITLDAWKSLIDIAEFISEPPYRIESVDGSYSTLGHTDQLLFLSLHMAKHFIESGLTIRMILDVALHFAKHRGEIDIDRYWSIICKLKFDMLMNNVFWIAVEYCGFSVHDFPGIAESKPTQIMDILSDLEAGGYMGVREMKERHESGMVYNRRLLLHSKSPIQYKAHMIAWKVRSGTKNMFPTYARLKQLYPCTEIIPIFAPVLWVYQMCSYPILKLRSGVLKQDILDDNNTIHELSKGRLELFEKLGML